MVYTLNLQCTITEIVCFSSIPRSEELRAKWIAVIKKSVSTYSKVCSDHFEPDVFEYKINKIRKVQRELKLVNNLLLTHKKSESCESQSVLKNISNNENSAIQNRRVIEDDSISCTFK